MNVRQIFLGSHGLRSGWRIALWIVASLALSIPLLVGGVYFFHVDPRKIPQAPVHVQMTLTAVGILPDLLLTWLFVHFLDRRPLWYVGLGGPAVAVAREIVLGVGLGALLLGAGLVVDAVGGGVSIAVAHPDPLRWIVFAGALALAATREELAFRGAPFQALVRGIGPAGATALFSVAFGLAHAANAHVTIFSLANIVAAGVLLSVAYFARQNLWFPIGLHFGWNAMQGMVLGIPISGNPGFPSLATTTLVGPEWRTGGSFGIEGSAGSLVAVAAGIVFLFAFRRPRATTPTV